MNTEMRRKYPAELLSYPYLAVQRNKFHTAMFNRESFPSTTIKAQPKFISVYIMLSDHVTPLYIFQFSTIDFCFK